MTLSIFQILMNVLKEVIHVIVMLPVWILRAVITVCVTWDSLEVAPIVLVNFFASTWNLRYNIVYTDIDECSVGIDECSSNATCTNTEGGYNCSCDTGYHGDGFTCNSTYVTYLYNMFKLYFRCRY